MKQLLASILLATMCTMAANAQQNNPWVESEKAAATVNADQKYLAGAVPEVDGHVVWQKTISLPGKSRDDIYDAMHTLMQGLTKDANQTEQSRMVVEDKEHGKLAGSYQEWLVFKNTALQLDRTRLLYHLIAECADGEVTLQMARIIYIYDEERDPQTYRAEEWISDKYGLNKKQDKLARVSGKFRRKTIDRKDFLFEKFETLLNK